MSVIHPASERLIRPLAWLRPGILLASIMQRPRGLDDGWINLVIRDSADPVMPHVLWAATLRKAADGTDRALGIAAAHPAPGALVRALCVTACAQLNHEIEHGPPSRPPPPRPRKVPSQSQKRSYVDRGEIPFSAMARPALRKRLILTAVAELEAINRAPAGVLPALQNCDGCLPCEELAGWFVLAPVKPPRATRPQKELVPA
jgi:hypothetical protein